MRYVNSVERLAREEGWASGRQEGIEQGIQQGRRVGKALLIERQLQVRFGELPGWVKIKLTDAGEEQLDTWSDQLVSAPSVEAVFGSAGHG